MLFAAFWYNYFTWPVNKAAEAISRGFLSHTCIRYIADSIPALAGPESSLYNEISPNAAPVKSLAALK